MTITPYDYLKAKLDALKEIIPNKVTAQNFDYVCQKLHEARDLCLSLPPSKELDRLQDRYEILYRQYQTKLATLEPH